MVKAFGMLHVDLGCERDVLRELRGMEGVVEAYVVEGVYDVVVVLEAEGLDDLRNVISKVRGMDNVQSTLTMIAVE
jgi:DNA-binding Lrp family transcriptional regulator